MPKKTKKVCPCGAPGIPGLVRSIALCQRHYNALMFGTGPEHKEAVEIYHKQK